MGVTCLKAFFSNAWANIVLWYHTRVQATFGWLLTGMSGADLLAGLTSYEHDLVNLLGVKLHAALRLTAAAIITFRAHQVSHQPKE
jgi:hypothetical protein